MEGGRPDCVDSSRQALRLFVHRQKPFHGRLHKIFKIWWSRKPSWGPGGFRGGGRLFLQDAGAAAHTREGSISSSPRATAGIRMSTGLDLGPLFGLNAVWTVVGRAGCAVACAAHGQARGRAPAPYIFARHGHQASKIRTSPAVPGGRASAGGTHGSRVTDKESSIRPASRMASPYPGWAGDLAPPSAAPCARSSSGET